MKKPREWGGGGEGGELVYGKCYQTDLTSGKWEKESAKHAEYTRKLLILGQSC